jgi:hypothetical protein
VGYVVKTNTTDIQTVDSDYPRQFTKRWKRIIRPRNHTTKDVMMEFSKIPWNFFMYYRSTPPQSPPERVS